MSYFAQNRGKIGPVFGSKPVNFAPTANPYVRKNWQPQPLGWQGDVSPPQAASATIAGLSVGCCGDCSSSHRNG